MRTVASVEATARIWSSTKHAGALREHVRESMAVPDLVPCTLEVACPAPSNQRLLIVRRSAPLSGVVGRYCTGTSSRDTGRQTVIHGDLPDGDSGARSRNVSRIATGKVWKGHAGDNQIG